MLFGATQSLIMLVLGVLFAGLKVWAFVDCVRRPAQAFPAIGRLNKVFWLLITGIAALSGLAFMYIPAVGLLGIAGLIAALVYLFDVRPRLIEISGGR
jgi:ABC-type Na+ efflux pump permease subunit